MQVFQNKISNTTLDIFRKHHEMFANDEALNEKHYGAGEVKTLIKKGTLAYEEIIKICNNHFSEDVRMYAAYQRQVAPTELHVDSNDDDDSPSHTICIPMHTDPRIGSVIFKEKFHTNEDFRSFLQDFPYESRKKLTNISERYDLGHTAYNYKNNDRLADFLQLDGAFEYKLGDYMLFEADQLHSSIDFRSYPEYEYKDLVQIHITVKK